MCIMVGSLEMDVEIAILFFFFFLIHVAYRPRFEFYGASIDALVGGFGPLEFCCGSVGWARVWNASRILSSTYTDADTDD